MKKCTACDREEGAVTFIRQGKLDLSVDPQRKTQKTVTVPVYFCAECATHLKQTFADTLASPAPDSPTVPVPNEPRIFCSFCHQDQFKRRLIFAVCRYYTIRKPLGGFEIHPVVHDHLFLAAYSDKKPEKVGEAFICSDCATSTV